ncbi:polymeric immunoglobulin receptor-like [Ictalurus furcatus]|uniref:polymeric immunoglobulin receptor-like n=1 Tax=Ictalurus furcatus TaxID=66913 RepID=UPI002350FBDB|nr:polymeric immunoglobulin receptor-like [Ictalurus furcatus]
MMKCLYLLSVVFHVAAGCSLSADIPTEITGHKGGSVLFPCSCSDLHTKPQKFTWESFIIGRATEVLNDEHYRGRLQLFNHISPANLSLFISDLREEDQGSYRCRTEKEHRDIRLYVKGCELVKTGVEDVTVFTGESVVLPCVCTDLQDKPKSVKWQFSVPANGINHFQEIYPEQTGHHRNRVKLVSNNAPGNLSLLISDLTEEDQGLYRCSVQADSRDVRLSVKVGRRETSTHSRKTDTSPPSEPPQSKTTNSPPASSSTTLEQDKQQTTSSLPLGRRETSTHSRKTDTTPSSEPPQSKTTNSPPPSSSTTLEQDKQQTHSSLPLGAKTFHQQ